MEQQPNHKLQLVPQQAVTPLQREASLITSSNCNAAWITLPARANTAPLDVVRCGAPALNALVRETGTQEVAITLVEFMVCDILEFYGIEWTPGRIRSMAEIFYEEYHFATVAELKQLSNRVKSGYFGKTYHKLAPNILMEMASAYFDEILEVRANYVAGQRKTLPPPSDNVKYVPAEQVSSAMRDIREQLQAKLDQEKQSITEQRMIQDTKSFATLQNLDWEALQAMRKKKSSKKPKPSSNWEKRQNRYDG